MDDDNLDNVDDQVADLDHGGGGKLNMSHEDLEHAMSGSNIVPKALPQITPDSISSQPPNFMNNRGQNHNQRQTLGTKRRHSGKDGNITKHVFIVLSGPILK
jgi:hypothetical protein